MNERTWRKKADIFPGHVESEAWWASGDPKVSPRFLNLPLRLPGTMKSVAQDEAGSDTVGSQEGPEGTCDLGWAVSKRQKLEGGACQGPGASLLAQEMLVRAS